MELRQRCILTMQREEKVVEHSVSCGMPFLHVLEDINNVDECCSNVYKIDAHCCMSAVTHHVSTVVHNVACLQ